jgi:UPF0755 protein
MVACYLSNYKKRCLTLILLLVCTIAILGYFSYLTLSKPLLAKHNNALFLEVKPATTATLLINRLYHKKVIKSHLIYHLLIKYKGYERKLKAGLYQIIPGQTINEVLQRIVRGDVITPSFRIIEGTTRFEVTQHLQETPFIHYKESDWLAINANYPSAEGLLLANTYHYNAYADARTLLQTANKALLKTLAISWANRAPNLPYKNPYQLLIVASIIEKEASHLKERYMIAGVIVNRLKKNMPLQMDPTVIYALGNRYTGKLTHADLLIDSPYNTYHYRGLPPTPIAMVGQAAIDAAAHPEVSDYLYYVAKGDGRHVFSTTYKAQRQAIARYLK